MKFNYKKSDDDSIIVDDPIYGTIVIPYPFSKIVLTKEMQRLSKISQNGFSKLEFKKLEENDRLSHSIGAFYVMSLFINRLEELLSKYGIKISKEDKEIALSSMLLHDIGHGPFSHSLECVTNYSHEKRTTDILLGNTEVNKVLTNYFGKDKVRKIASFIAEINDSKDISKDSFTRLLNNLVSYQIDADRIDYLARDSYYVGIKSSIDLDRIIRSINVVVNNDQEYELLIDRKGLSSIENVLLQRYQMYRDVYLSPISVLGDYLFKIIIERAKRNIVIDVLGVSDSFKKITNDPKISNLDDFLSMSDDDFNLSFRVLANEKYDHIMSYLCSFNNIKDYTLMKKSVSIDAIKNRLKEIFGDIDLDNTLSIMSIDAKTKLYKKEQKLKIKNANRIMDLTEVSNLIRPQEVFEDTYVFFNSELLRLELGFSEEEFSKYEREINKMIDELNKNPEEFELKYIIDKPLDEINETHLLKELLTIFQENGFEVVSINTKQNNDEYYDTYDLDLYNSGGSLRIRKIKSGNKEKIKFTLKTPLEKGEVYSSRNETEDFLENDSFESLISKLEDLYVCYPHDLLNSPILNSTTNRRDIVLEKNGVRVCLSFDISLYTNHKLGEITTLDQMIEIEAIGDINDRVILNEIHSFISKNISYLKINKQSKYERGINSTSKKYADNLTEGGVSLSLKPNNKK